MGKKKWKKWPKTIKKTVIFFGSGLGFFRLPVFSFFFGLFGSG